MSLILRNEKENPDGIDEKKLLFDTLLVMVKDIEEIKNKLNGEQK